MSTPQSYTVLGTGALGGYYGARLARGGCSVRFILHSDYDHVRKHGLSVRSVHGDFSIAQPEIYPDTSGVPASDVVLVALKTTSNDQLGELLPPLVGANTCVLMMQNGLGVEDDAAAAVPGAPIVGGLAFLCSNKTGPGEIRHLDYGDIRLGEHRPGGHPAGLTDRIQTIAADFERAGIGASLEEDLVMARWKKLVWNVPFNGMCVIRNCTTDVLMANPEDRALCRSLMDEVLEASRACGHAVEPFFAEAMMQATEAMAKYRPSMKLDFDTGRPLEIEAIYARPLRAAREAGLECPRISELHERLLAVGPRA